MFAALLCIGVVGPMGLQFGPCALQGRGLTTDGTGQRRLNFIIFIKCYSKLHQILECDLLFYLHTRTVKQSLWAVNKTSSSSSSSSSSTCVWRHYTILATCMPITPVTCTCLRLLPGETTRLGMILTVVRARVLHSGQVGHTALAPSCMCLCV